MKSPVSDRRFLPIIVTLVLGIAISCVAAYVRYQNVDSSMRADYRHMSLIHAMAMQGGVEAAINTGNLMPGLFAAANGNVSAGQFREFTRPVLRENPAVNWVGWAPLRTASVRNGAGRHGRAKGGNATGMVQVYSGGSFVAEKPHGTYFPLTYITQPTKRRLGAGDVTPAASIASVAGIDIGSVSPWRKAMDAAAVSGRVRVASAGMDAPSIWPKSTVIAFDPVYRSGMPHTNAQERKENLAGFVVTLVSMHNVIENSLHFNVPVAGGAHLALKLERPRSGTTQIYYHESRTVGGGQSGVVSPAVTKELIWTYHFKIGGRTWTIVSLPAPEFLARQPLTAPWWVLGIGFVLTFLLAGYFVTARRAAIALATETERKLAEGAKKEEENRVVNDSIISILRSVAKMAKGDLTVEVPVSEDITGALSDAVNHMSESMGKTLSHVNEVSERVIGASDEVKGVAARSKDAVAQTLRGMTDLRTTIQEIAKRIKRLGERSQEIGNIIKIIDNIAERTNVLALNANMQAASAGEAGRGFMVVAAEVQRLAESSKEATNQIAGLVTSIQGETSDAISTMDKAITEVVKGGQLAEQAAATMDQTEQTVRTLNDLGGDLLESVRAFVLPETKSATRYSQVKASRAVA